MTNRELDGKQLFLDKRVFYGGKLFFHVNSKIFKTDETTCDCPDFSYRRPIGGCKHIHAVKFWLKENKDPRIEQQQKANQEFLDLICYMEKNSNVVKYISLSKQFSWEKIDKAIEKSILKKAGDSLVLIV